MLDDQLISFASRLSSASLHEAGSKVGALPSSLKPLAQHQRVCGPAYPVACPAGDNLFLHHAIYSAQPGDVLMVQTFGGREFGYWGEIMAAAAQARGLAGLVITGGVRDSLRMVEMEFPVFAETTCIHGTRKNPRALGRIGETVRIGNITVAPGDLVFGDADGVVVIPKGRAEEVCKLAAARDAEEADILQRLRDGDTTLSIYDLPDIATERVELIEGSRRSIQVEGLSHGQLPIPSASRVGQILATGGVGGKDPVTGLLAETVEAQAAQMFANLRTVVEAGGARAEDILKLNIVLAAPDSRAAVNPPWLDMFPHPESRPARHIVVHDLPGGMQIQCEALAILQAPL